MASGRPATPRENAVKCSEPSRTGTATSEPIVAQGCGMGGNRLTLAQIAATGGGLVDTRGDGLRRVSEVLEGVFWTEVNEPNDDARRRYYFSNDGSRPSRKDLEDWRKKIQKASE
jgi:hypothetical protein